MARRIQLRRAMSFLELTAVLAIVGLLSVAAISSFGHSTLSNGGAQGVARKLALALIHARRATISTGDNHYLQLAPAATGVTSFALYRRAISGNVQVDTTRTIPSDVTVTASATTLEFDFDGAALAGYSLTVAGDDRSWSIIVATLTGAVTVVETTP